MFIARQITPIPVSCDCAGCGRAMVQATFELVGRHDITLGRTRVGYICAACAAWAKRWEPEPLPVPDDYDFANPADAVDVDLVVTLKDGTPLTVGIGRSEGDETVVHVFPPQPVAAPPDLPAAIPASDERILMGLRAGASIETIARHLGREPWEIEERAEELCPEPRDATTIGAALRHLKETAHA